MAKTSPPASPKFHVAHPKKDNEYDKNSILNIKGTYYTHGVGEVPKGEEGRKVRGGPMVAGPWAYTYGRSTCIHDGTMEQKNAEQADIDARTIEVEHGDWIMVSGELYKVKVFRREYIDLIPQAEAEEFKK